MRIALGSDHAGFDLKQQLLQLVSQLGHTPIDCGTHGRDPVDYPYFAAAVGRTVQSGAADRGIVVCGSGVGASVAANKIAGVRAGLCHDTYSAHQGVEHDNMNVLCLGARVIGPELMADLLRAYLGAKFTGEERHVRRLAKVDVIEHSQLQGANK